MTNDSIREKLPPIQMENLSDDNLFFIFYNFCGETHQILAAQALYDRHWRFHITEKFWITRQKVQSSQGLFDATGSGERNIYMIFDHLQWKRVIKEMFVVYDHLAPRSSLSEDDTLLNSTGESDHHIVK